MNTWLNVVIYSHCYVINAHTTTFTNVVSLTNHAVCTIQSGRQLDRISQKFLLHMFADISIHSSLLDWIQFFTYKIEDNTWLVIYSRVSSKCILAYNGVVIWGPFFYPDISGILQTTRPFSFQIRLDSSWIFLLYWEIK